MSAARPRRILIVFNPAAGSSRSSARRMGQILAGIERLGCTAIIRTTLGPGDAERLAYEAEPGFDLVVAAGGDGTINQVANGLWRRDPAGATRPPLAILPFGTANVLAREIGLPRASSPLARMLAFAPAQPAWPGRAGERLFLMMVGSGFDAEVVAAVDPAMKRRFGRLAFVWAIFGRLLGFACRELVVELDGREHRAAAAIVSNGRHYAGGFVLVPAASIDDPGLHVVLFHRSGRLAALRYMLALPLGFLHRLGDVEILPARAATITGAGSTPYQIDGEITGALPVRIEGVTAPLMLVRPERQNRRRV